MWSLIKKKKETGGKYCELGKIYIFVSKAFMANVKEYIVLLNHVQFSHAVFLGIMLLHLQNLSKLNVHSWLSSVECRVVRKYGSVIVINIMYNQHIVDGATSHTNLINKLQKHINPGFFVHQILIEW